MFLFRFLSQQRKSYYKYRDDFALKKFVDKTIFRGIRVSGPDPEINFDQVGFFFRVWVLK